jgi:hypothetical protein
MEAIKKAIKSPSAKAIFELYPPWRTSMRASRPSRGVEARF